MFDTSSDHDPIAPVSDALADDRARRCPDCGGPADRR